jgi:formylglycine-generating enzyme required for sulfatase activity
VDDKYNYTFKDKNMNAKSFRTLYVAILALSMIAASGSGIAMAKSKDKLRTYTNSIGMKFVLIPAGRFRMGTDKTVKFADYEERPGHEVRIDKPFYISVYNVTQSQWERVMGNNPSEFKGKNHPVEMVSWDTTHEFIRRLNEKEGHSRYRIPTEAEWEYAARAGSTGYFFFGDSETLLWKYAWWDGNTNYETHPVGKKLPNDWGLYDIIGNVFEWTSDWYGESYYNESPAVDPSGPASGTHRVVRSCGYETIADDCRMASRGRAKSNVGYNNFGIRLVLTARENE